MFVTHKEQKYESLSSNDLEHSIEQSSPASKDASNLQKQRIFISFLTFLISFAAGGLSVYIVIPKTERCQQLDNVAPRIPLPLARKQFNFSTDFSKEPPQGYGAGEIAEPIWDSLIPNGLGYFKDEDLAPQISIPTVFHQLHCLYILRRAYYSRSDELQRFDFGRNRTAHVAHCFDYLQQGLTCSVDTTVEPAVDRKHGFLGSGFARRCRDFEALKKFVQERRVFDAKGFLAEGLEF